jgi:hypothetical protein
MHFHRRFQKHPDIRAALQKHFQLGGHQVADGISHPGIVTDQCHPHDVPP